jgi:site-specific DNA-methyltransferase (cytosine-N4-specific)
VLPISNTSSNDSYNQLCRDKKAAPHPARMPEALAGFFVQFLTDPGDVVLDPFAGSNTTGVVAERFNRRWLGIEMSEAYAESAKARFGGSTKKAAA